MTKLLKTLMTLCLVLIAHYSHYAHAQGAYRCDDNGKVTYQAAPCAGGKAVQQATAPGALDQAAARESAALERQKAADMARERAARERVKGNTAGAGEIGTMKATSMQEREGVTINKKKGKHAKHSARPKAKAKAPAGNGTKKKAKQAGTIVRP